MNSLQDNRTKPGRSLPRVWRRFGRVWKTMSHQAGQHLIQYVGVFRREYRDLVWIADCLRLWFAIG